MNARRIATLLALACTPMLPLAPAQADIDSVLKMLQDTGTDITPRDEAPLTLPNTADNGEAPRADRSAFPGSTMGRDASPSAAADTWGDARQQVPRPQAPNRSDLPWFQTLVDEAPEGSTLKPPAGRYAGPVVIHKALTIEGEGVIIDGGGKGTVMVLQASGATLRGLHLTGSGDNHDSDDACLNVRGNDNVIEHLTVDDCLFGIDLKAAERNRIAHTSIRSKPFDLGLRGDSIRLWSSHENQIVDNRISDTRDMVAWYSNKNVFARNEARRSRYSLHFMFANQNLVEDNRFYDNSVGVYVMYAGYSTIRNNLISHASGAAGMAVGLKEASDVIIENNEIIYCAVGIGSDISPFEPDSKVIVRGNRFAYNGIGISFTSDIGGTEVTGNDFDGNLAQIAVGGAGSATKSLWRGNHWDDYQGFDRNADGIGDTPHELFAFADQIWMEQPYARFFKNAPMLEALDFLERLAPFTSPVLLLRDDAPQYRRQKAS